MSHVTSCYVCDMSCHNISSILCHISLMSCHLSFVMSCIVMSLHALSCHVMHCHVTPCIVMSLHALSCHASSCIIMSYLLDRYSMLSLFDSVYGYANDIYELCAKRARMRQVKQMRMNQSAYPGISRRPSSTFTHQSVYSDAQSYHLNGYG